MRMRRRNCRGLRLHLRNSGHWTYPDGCGNYPAAGVPEKDRKGLRRSHEQASCVPCEKAHPAGGGRVRVAHCRVQCGMAGSPGLVRVRLVPVWEWGGISCSGPASAGPESFLERDGEKICTFFRKPLDSAVCRECSIAPEVIEMKMKEVIQQTGLPEKTIRFYEDI